MQQSKGFTMALKKNRLAAIDKGVDPFPQLTLLFLFSYSLSFCRIALLPLINVD